MSKRRSKTGRRRYATPQEAFAARTVRNADGCLVWTGGINSVGYGQLTHLGIARYVHRWIWEQAHGPIPDGLLIDHTCHNRACVELTHLRMASRAENNYNRSGPHGPSGLPRNVFKHRSKFTVRITRKGVRYWYGSYSTAEEAAKVAALKRAELFGEFAGKG